MMTKFCAKKVFWSEKKMAALNQERFILANDDTMEELRNGGKNNNTIERTSFWLSVWKTWCLT